MWRQLRPRHCCLMRSVADPEDSRPGGRSSCVLSQHSGWCRTEGSLGAVAPSSPTPGGEQPLRPRCRTGVCSSERLPPGRGVYFPVPGGRVRAPLRGGLAPAQCAPLGLPPCRGVRAGEPPVLPGWWEVWPWASSGRSSPSMCQLGCPCDFLPCWPQFGEGGPQPRVPPLQLGEGWLRGQCPRGMSGPCPVPAAPRGAGSVSW